MRILPAVVTYFFIMSQAFAACTLPASTATEVGRAVDLTDLIPDLSVLAGGARHTMWGNNGSTANIPAGVYGNRYMTAMRSPYQYGSYIGRKIDWYRTNVGTPSYIVLRPDHKTPAWMFCSPATDFTLAACDDSDRTPLAIWDTNVRNYIKGADIAAVIANGTYSGMNVDNSYPLNNWYRAGTCSGDPTANGTDFTKSCEAAGFTWTSRYKEAHVVVLNNAAAGATTIDVTCGLTEAFNCATDFTTGMRFQVRDGSTTNGTRKDDGHSITSNGTAAVGATPARIHIPNLPSLTINAGDIIEAVDFADTTHSGDLSNWLQDLGTYLHPYGLCVGANMVWSSSARAQWIAQAADVDLVWEEIGFTGTDHTYDVPKSEDANALNTWVWYDTAWVNKSDDYLTIGATKPFAIMHQNSTNSRTRNRRIIYGLASYLLVKNDNAYQAIVDSPDRNDFQDYVSDQYWVHGAASGARTLTGGVYYRDFANGKVLVNPSSTDTVTYDLSTSVYHTYDGLNWTGVVTLTPVTAMILHSGASSGPIVLTQ